MKLKLKMVKKIRILLFFLIIGIFIVTFLYFTQENIFEDDFERLKIGNTEIDVELAENLTQRSRGLSYKESIQDDYGMFFVFEESRILKFWMKDMNFPIDIIWIDENFKIVDLTLGVKPESYPMTFSPTVSSRYVLEINSGLVERYNIKIGGVVEFLK